MLSRRIQGFALLRGYQDVLLLVWDHPLRTTITVTEASTPSLPYGLFYFSQENVWNMPTICVVYGYFIAEVSNCKREVLVPQSLEYFTILPFKFANPCYRITMGELGEGEGVVSLTVGLFRAFNN